MFGAARRIVRCVAFESRLVKYAHMFSKSTAHPMVKVLATLEEYKTQIASAARRPPRTSLLPFQLVFDYVRSLWS